MSDSDWSRTWRDIIVPLLAPPAPVTWESGDHQAGRRRVYLYSPDEQQAHRRPRKTAV